MPSSLVRDADRQLIDRERTALDALRGVLAATGASPDSIEALDRSIRQLDGLFLLVVAGEFNAGKSAFINALVGQPLLEEGVTPTTAQVHLLQYGETRSRVEQSAHLHVITAPVALLRDMHLVDTPGTNAVIREHEAITSAFLPRADLVLFVTSVDRPFTESERQFLTGIREWGKKIVIVLNKVDLIESPDALQQVVAFVAEGARRFLGVEPEIFPVSARLALRAKTGQPELLAASRFEALEAYVFGRLDERERLRLKLANPLGVG
ncbi:MAG TPA: dynamin family protein, partial [Vicinamibacterales bacterium]